jgi:hypothetical protein
MARSRSCSGTCARTSVASLCRLGEDYMWPGQPYAVGQSKGPRPGQGSRDRILWILGYWERA